MAWPPAKNLALNFEVIIRDADGDPISDPAGLTLKYSGDGGAVTTGSVPTVITAGQAFVAVALTQAQMNVDRISVLVESTSTGAKGFFVNIFTTKNPLDTFTQIIECTVDTGASTTTIPVSAMDPSSTVVDQWKGRIVIFKRDTTTTGLRGQAKDITASSAGGTLTVTALTTTPVAGDTFIIV